MENKVGKTRKQHIVTRNGTGDEHLLGTLSSRPSTHVGALTTLRQILGLLQAGPRLEFASFFMSNAATKGGENLRTFGTSFVGLV